MLDEPWDRGDALAGPGRVGERELLDLFFSPPLAKQFVDSARWREWVWVRFQRRSRILSRSGAMLCY